MRAVPVLLIAASLLRVCGPSAPPDAASHAVVTPVRDAPRAPTVSSSLPLHGGVVAVSDNLVGEVVPGPDGALTVYLDNTQGEPQRPADLRLAVRRESNEEQPVAVAYDPARGAYVGQVAGLAPGAYPVTLSVRPAGATAPVQLVTAPVRVEAPRPLPPAHHGGTVQLLGDRAVEVVASRTGDVALYWTDPNGTPLPEPGANVPSVEVRVNGQPHIVQLRLERTHFVGHVDVPTGAELAIALPPVEVDGRMYYGVAAPRPVLVEVLPGGPVAVVQAPPVVVVEQPPQPVVVVEQPPPPAVVFVAPSPPVFVVEQPGVIVMPGHVPHGEAHGWWGNRGGGGGEHGGGHGHGHGH